MAKQLSGLTGVPKPTRQQYRAARLVTAWYLANYFRTPADVGVPAMFCDPSLVGHFAVDAEALAGGSGEALFRMMVTMTMFQRRSDLQIMRVLRGIARPDAEQLTSAQRLLELADSVGCPHIKDVDALRDECDLGKHETTKRGICHRQPDTNCHLKKHTEWLKRYGHFGKVPTSAAMMLRANGVADLSELRRAVWGQTASPIERAARLEEAITRAWRISDKIAAMFLSAVTNRDLSGRLAPWADGVDSASFLVIDSNVDLFLRAIGYPGPWTYQARRGFVQALGRRVPLDVMHPGLSRYNPRIVQQALYMFMSVSNRRANADDCGQFGVQRCAECPPSLAPFCARRSVTP